MLPFLLRDRTRQRAGAMRGQIVSYTIRTVTASLSHGRADQGNREERR